VGQHSEGVECELHSSTGVGLKHVVPVFCQTGSLTDHWANPDFFVGAYWMALSIRATGARASYGLHGVLWLGPDSYKSVGVYGCIASAQLNQTSAAT
jgi:hypothetical protein